jgi:hypothetical protein
VPKGAEVKVNTVGLGCCVKDIPVRDAAVLGANSVTHAKNDFIMTLNSDKKIYRTKDTIKIWGTLEYVGGNDTATIWHGCPFMLFSVTGDRFGFGNAAGTISFTSVLGKDRVYHFDYEKSDGWDADSTNAEFWENFFSEKDLLLPVGKYIISLKGGFSLSENVSGSESGLECNLVIAVVQ